MPLSRLFGRSDLEMDLMVQKIQQTASQLGLPFGSVRTIYNSRLAQEVGLWAETQGKGEEFHMAAFQAYLVHKLNFAETEVLLSLVESVGLSREKALAVIEKRSFSDAVDRDWKLSRSLGITAIPTLVYEKRQLTGAHPYDQMRHFMRESHPGIRI
ncbi:hypothetical protein DSLASN_20080 [Desulfoluna limicola]|uniref:DSBA-like thioredoxin domain-containing protein n=1 Tax=Desulfoluna limicola TaxID=2810562 RepID=A0ABM7PGL4_9BACT|nr:hypothetical protein DSLASN_20080 [Desulfoluna limicola]